MYLILVTSPARRFITMEQQHIVHQSPKGMWVSKFTLRMISAILDLILIGLAGAVGTKWVSPATVYFLPPVRACYI